MSFSELDPKRLLRDISKEAFSYQDLVGHKETFGLFDGYGSLGCLAGAKDFVVNVFSRPTSYFVRNSPSRKSHLGNPVLTKKGKIFARMVVNVCRAPVENFCADEYAAALRNILLKSDSVYLLDELESGSKARSLLKIIKLVESDVDYKRLKSASRNRQLNAQRNYRNYCRYFDQLFSRYSRMSLLRVDLGYRKEIISSVSVDHVMFDLKRFLNNRRSNKAFSSIVGFVWKLEWGVEKGYHLHWLFFLDGSKVRNDVYHAEVIGKYWNEVITRGEGNYFNCNRRKTEYKRIGIGMISHNESDKRENLKMVLAYLCKSDQYLRVKQSLKGRSIGRGTIRSANKRTGRRRRISLMRGDA